MLKPASEVDLTVWKQGRTSALKAAPAGIIVKPWTVSFVNDFMSGEPIDWQAYDPANPTQGPPSGKRPLPKDYRTLADQFISDYRQIWQDILIIPGTMGDAEWAITLGGSPSAGWF